jgi:hypothetical protein
VMAVTEPSQNSISKWFSNLISRHALAQNIRPKQLRQLGDIGRDPPRHSEKLVERHWQWLAGTCC